MKPEQLLSLYQTILDGIDISIYVLDANGYFIYMNAAAQQITGIKKFVPYTINIFSHRNSHSVLVSDIVFATKQKVCLFQDINRPASSLGYSRNYRQLITSTPIFNGEGNIEYLVATFETFDDICNKLQTAGSKGTIPALDLHFPTQQETYIAENKQTKALFHLADQVKDTAASVLLSGETGSGKEVIAHYLHHTGKRTNAPFIAVNCSAIPESILESELFGCLPGTFTGALRSGKSGLISEAHGGSLFLDEIDSLPLSMQSKLLRVLETKKIRRIGSNKEEPVDFRLITATNKDLKQLCLEGSFREDLFYRICVVPLEIPPLRERVEDIVPLATLFLNDLNHRYEKIRFFSEEALQQLLSYTWPGNIRELRNLIERIFVTSQESTVEIKRIPESMFYPSATQASPPSNTYLLVRSGDTTSCITDANFSLENYMDTCEQTILSATLSSCKNIEAAAKTLKISRSSVIRRKRKYQL